MVQPRHSVVAEWVVEAPLPMRLNYSAIIVRLGVDAGEDEASQVQSHLGDAR
jgi:hypothetical protein